MKITKDLLKKWGACTDGYKWYVSKFPQAASYSEVNKALRDDKRYEDSIWLTNRVFAEFFEQPELIAAVVKSEVDQALAEIKDSPSSAIGYSSTAASSGDSSTAASSGDSSTAASSGDSSKAASSGDSSKAASSGNYSTAASSGNYSTAEAKGLQTIAMVAGINGLARAGEKGAFALAWLEGEQTRIAVGIVGENGIKADIWYCVSKTGQLEEVES